MRGDGNEPITDRADGNELLRICPASVGEATGAGFPGAFPGGFPMYPHRVWAIRVGVVDGHLQSWKTLRWKREDLSSRCVL